MENNFPIKNLIFFKNNQIKKKMNKLLEFKKKKKHLINNIMIKMIKFILKLILKLI